jgi:hypothetical protein
MSKSASLKIEQPNLAGFLVPAGQQAAKMRHATERLLLGWSEIVAREVGFLQQKTLDELSELQDLSRVRGPDEYFQLATKFAFAELEHSTKSFTVLCEEIGHVWLQTLQDFGRIEGGK